ASTATSPRGPSSAPARPRPSSQCSSAKNHQPCTRSPFLLVINLFHVPSPAADAVVHHPQPVLVPPPLMARDHALVTIRLREHQPHRARHRSSTYATRRTGSEMMNT